MEGSLETRAALAGDIQKQQHTIMGGFHQQTATVKRWQTLAENGTLY